MLQKFFDEIAGVLYNSLNDFDGLNKVVLLISLIVFTLGIIAAIYMYKQVKALNEKTFTIMEKHEQAQRDNVKEYKELNKAGILILEKVNETMQQHSASNKEIVHAMEKNNVILDVILKKVL